MLGDEFVLFQDDRLIDISLIVPNSDISLHEYGLSQQYGLVEDDQI